MPACLSPDSAVWNPYGERPPDVLLVEDDATDALLTNKALHGLGYSVETCASSDAAFALLEKVMPRVIITDYRLGPADGLDGLGVCRHLLDNHLETPVIVLTGHADIRLAVDAIRAGAFDFVTKERVFARFANVLGQSVGEAIGHRGDSRRDPASVAPAPTTGAPLEASPHLSTLEEVERQHIAKVLAITGYNKTRAANILGLDRVTLYRKLRRYARHGLRLEI